MAQPVAWMAVLDAWATLGLNEWLEVIVADFYLSHMWYGLLGKSHMRYIGLHVARVSANDIEDEEVENFWRNNLLPHKGICPVLPVRFVVHHSQHFFTVIFDYQQHKVHVLGCYITADDNAMDINGMDPDNWNEWNGLEYWRRIGVLHGWKTGDVTDVSVIFVDWEQNGVDCGPIACSVLKQCLNSGLDEHGDLPVFQIQCGHRLRIHMLCVITGRIKICCSDYLMLLDSSLDDWQQDDIPDEDIINAIQNGCHQSKCLKLLQKLTVVSATCSKCQRPMVHQDSDNPPHDPWNEDQSPGDQDSCEAERSDDEESLGMALPADRKVKLAKIFKASRLLTGSRNCNAIVPCAIGTHLQLELDALPDIEATNDSQCSVSALASHRKVKDWHLRSNKQFPRPIAPPALAAYAGRRWLQDSHTFDDYDGGPTIKMLIAPRDIIQQ
ncbi:uncharacterized protein BJ212DRAFT_1480154 [Suillus subaureus]|uniref:Ubiquitin-like protease family profile domain-containing protein n=1 Tax=Suillus subaureus TaxID=48587 RepID=A0A9P7EC51_9AGAM|nr:uncharacterized protein BJ212DRAFT_1480154 [Suillus subaureus]KAG1817591.1 hypothetical protein BJ212DRAFT_1480154 [Suillus subaureus]